MKKILPAILFTALATSLVAAPPFQQIIGEDVELFISVRSLSELREQWSEHPIAEIFQDEDVLELFDSSQDDVKDDESLGFFEKIEDIFGLTEDEFFELFPGQISLALYNMSAQFLQEDEQVEFIFMTEFTGDAERLDELMQMQFERNAKMQKEKNPLVEHDMVEEKFMDEILHFDETFNGETTYVEDGYALVDGIFVLAAPESCLRRAVEMIKEGPETPLASLEAYRRSREHSGRGDLSLYLNLRELVPPLNAALGELPINNGALALMGVTPQSLQSALSLEVLQGLFLDFDMVEDGILGHYGSFYSEKAGLLSLLEYVEGELPEAPYVPENVLSSSVTLFDLSAMYNSLEKILSTASPHILSMVDIQMQQVQSNTGVDLRSGLLENFGTQLVVFSVLKEDASATEVGLIKPEQVIVIDLKNAEAFSQSFNALIDSAGGVRSSIQESTFEGETIYSIVNSDMKTGESVEVHYAITRSNLILVVGHVSLLHNVMTKLDNDIDGFWQDPELIDLFNRIAQPNPVTRSYYDAEQLIEPFFKMMVGFGRFGSPSAAGKFEEVPESLKGAYRIIVEGNEAPGGFFGRTLILKAKEEK